VPEIISKCCELVKLCQINHSCPFFFETHCIYRWIIWCLCYPFLCFRN